MCDLLRDIDNKNNKYKGGFMENSEQPFRYIRMKELVKITSISRAGLYQLIKRGDFIPPTRLSEKIIGFRSDLVENWMKTRPFDGTRKGGIAHG